MALVSWIVLGLLAGALAKWLMPGNYTGGWGITSLLGVVGAFFGGWLGSFVGVGVTGGLSIPSLITATLGAVCLLWLYKVLKP